MSQGVQSGLQQWEERESLSSEGRDGDWGGGWESPIFFSPSMQTFNEQQAQHKWKFLAYQKIWYVRHLQALSPLGRGMLAPRGIRDNW